jgi:hypothetical protein
LTVGHFGDGSGDALTEVPAGIIAASIEFFSSAFVGNGAHLNTIKYNSIDIHGKYADPTATVRWDATAPTNGGGSATILPQAALVVSIMTANARGLAHTGRFYSPAFALPVSSDGRIAEAYATTVAEAATALLNAVNSDDASFQVAVVSDVGEGHQVEATHVRVGRVVDTMRSRRTSLPEGYIDGAALA